ncbi:LIPR2-like protein, partial [Mya arenaria]
MPDKPMSRTRNISGQVSDILPSIKADVNVVAVDWERGAGQTEYSQSAANTRVVGALIAHLLNALRDSRSLKFENVHLVGHSLGAHFAGYAGERVKSVSDILPSIKADVNVVAVDWERGAGQTEYSQSAANTRVVGALIAHLLNALRDSRSLKFQNVHLVGHSLGAHFAGYAGERVKS